MCACDSTPYNLGLRPYSKECQQSLLHVRGSSISSYNLTVRRLEFKTASLESGSPAQLDLCDYRCQGLAKTCEKPAKQVE